MSNKEELTLPYVIEHLKNKISDEKWRVFIEYHLKELGSIQQKTLSDWWIKEAREYSIDLFNGNKDNRPYAWANIQGDSRNILIGMYEDGGIARTLFFMDRERAIQLASTILLLFNEKDKK